MKVPVVSLMFVILHDIVFLRGIYGAYNVMGTRTSSSYKEAEEDRDELKELLKELEMYDTNKDGYLNLEEFSAPMEKDHVPSPAELFKLMDVDGNNLISAEEVRQAYAKLQNATAEEGIRVEKSYDS